MKDWAFQLLPEHADVGSIIDESENGYRVCSAIWKTDAEKILALRDSHAELMASLRSLKNTLNTTRIIMHSDEARQLAGEIVEEANQVLLRAKKLTGESQ